jgi:diaminopimelate epimerase
MEFSKYEGCGNDFVFISEQAAAEVTGTGTPAGISAVASAPLGALARELCHRQLGIGADGLVIVRTNPLEMDIYNSDGSHAPMCGNAIRCFAHYCIAEALLPADAAAFDVETGSGTKHLTIIDRGDATDDFSVEVCMGQPDFSAASLGFTGDADPDGGLLHRQVEATGRTLTISGVNTGTIHIVVWLDGNDITSAASPLDLYGDPEVDRIGSALCSHELFGEKTNVNFARIIGPDEISMITWERGAGLTAACGTGACAAAVLGMREAGLGSTVTVYLPYGELIIREDKEGKIHLRGPATRTFCGYI